MMVQGRGDGSNIYSTATCMSITARSNAEAMVSARDRNGRRAGERAWNRVRGAHAMIGRVASVASFPRANHV
jgi:hypothetical protein